MSSEPRGYVKPSAHPQGVSFRALDWAQGSTLQPPHKSNANMIINATGELSPAMSTLYCKVRASDGSRQFVGQIIRLSDSTPAPLPAQTLSLVVTTILITAAIAVLMIES